MPASGTLDRMGKKRKSDDDKKGEGGKQSPRKPIQLPAPWYEVAVALSRKKPTPTVWYLIELLKREAEAAGMTDLPPTPWDEEK